MIRIMLVAAGAAASSSPAMAADKPAMAVARLVALPLDYRSYYLGLVERSIRQWLLASPQVAEFTREHPAAVPAAVNAARAEFEHQLDDVIAPSALRAAAAIYEQSYTSAELDQLRAFYSTTEGQLTFHVPVVDNRPREKVEAAANSPRGIAFLRSPVGKRENGGIYHSATEAAALAARAAVTAGVPALRQRAIESLAASGFKATLQ